MIRSLLGTDVPDIGFNVVYQRQPDGAWFPATVDTELRVRAAFIHNRQVSVSLRNRGFEHTHVATKVKAIGEVK